MSAFCLQKFIYISVWRQSGCTVKAKVVNFWWASMMNFWSSCFQCVLYILERIGKRTRSWIWSCPRFKSINRVFVSLDLAVSFILYFSCFDLWIFFLTFLYDKIRDLKIIALTSKQTNTTPVVSREKIRNLRQCAKNTISREENKNYVKPCLVFWWSIVLYCLWLFSYVVKKLCFF